MRGNSVDVGDSEEFECFSLILILCGESHVNRMERESEYLLCSDEVMEACKNLHLKFWYDEFELD